MMRLAMDTTLEIEIEGTYQQGARDQRTADGTWLPGEGPSIEGMRVMLVNGSKRLDITAMLSADKIRELEEDSLELFGAG
jgi:hypothetical protein